MTATLITIATLAPDGDTHLQRYAEKVTPLLHAAGATIRGRYKGVESLVGARHPDLVSVMDFPNAQAIKDFFASPSYQEALPHRQRAFRELQTFIAETLPSGE